MARVADHVTRHSELTWARRRYPRIQDMGLKVGAPPLMGLYELMRRATTA